MAQTPGKTSVYIHPVVGEPVPEDLNSNYEAPPTIGSVECNNIDPATPCPYDNLPIRYMAVNVHFLLSSDGKFNFSETGDGRGGSYNGYQRAEDIIKEANAQLAENSAQYQAVTVPVCKINFQLVLAGVYFHRTTPSVQVGTNPVRYNWNTIWPTLNSYLVNNNAEVNCFCFNATPSADGLADGSNITLQNDWERYHRWENQPNPSSYPRGIAARIILHEIFHNNGLKTHPFQIDECDDTPTFPRCWQYGIPATPTCTNWANISNNIMDYNSAGDWSLSPCQICNFNQNIQTNRLISQGACILPAPVRAFFDLPEKICAGSNVILQGSASFNEDAYSITVREIGSPSIVGRNFTGQVGTVNLTTAIPVNFAAGKSYSVTLHVTKILPNGCESYHSMTRNFTIGCFSSDLSGDDVIRDLSVSPNPTTGIINVQFNMEEEKDVSVQVYNLHTGTLVGTLKAMDLTPVGLQTLNWDASPFSDGWYYVRAVSYNEAKTASFLLQK